ncbi:MAG: DsbC family protein [Halioglobus sp.]|nr:DsbC family protein [Halioglobus sp.]
MIDRTLKSALTVSFAIFAVVSMAGEPLTSGQMDKLRAGLEKPDVGLKVISAETSVVAGLVEVTLSEGPVVYATPDGKQFIVGDLYAVGPDGYTNLTERRRDAERATLLASVKREDMIIFGPEKAARSHVTVFFDDTCYYCQKLHGEVAALNAAGVEVRYLAYPRAGLSSDAFKNLASAWCADDPNATLVQLINKEKVSMNVCESNPVAAQYKLGQEMGVRGTPAIVTASGQMIPGYQSADELLVNLGLN